MIRSSGSKEEEGEKAAKTIKPRAFMMVTLVGVAESSESATEFLVSLRKDRIVKTVDPEYLKEFRRDNLVYQEFRIRLEFQGARQASRDEKSEAEPNRGGQGR